MSMRFATSRETQVSSWYASNGLKRWLSSAAAEAETPCRLCARLACRRLQGVTKLTNCCFAVQATPLFGRKLPVKRVVLTRSAPGLSKTNGG